MSIFFIRLRMQCFGYVKQWQAGQLQVAACMFDSRTVQPQLALSLGRRSSLLSPE